MLVSDVDSSGAEGVALRSRRSRSEQGAGVERRASFSGYEMDIEEEEEDEDGDDRRVGLIATAGPIPSGYSSEQLPQRPRLPPAYRHPMLNSSPKDSRSARRIPRRQRGGQQPATPYSPPLAGGGVPATSGAKVFSLDADSHAVRRCTVYCVGTALQLEKVAPFFLLLTLALQCSRPFLRDPGCASLTSYSPLRRRTASAARGTRTASML